MKTLQIFTDARRIPQPQRTDIACSIPDPIGITGTKSSSPIKLNTKLALDCSFATILGKFLNETAQPLAMAHFGEPLTAIVTGPGFVCRRRNNAPTGKLSEHAFGNAIDLASFRFSSGRILHIGAPAEMKPEEAAFFTAFRQASCKAFTTVLGPGANPAHATHLHLDLGRSKSSKIPYRICE